MFGSFKPLKKVEKVEPRVINKEVVITTSGKKINVVTVEVEKEFKKST